MPKFKLFVSQSKLSRIAQIFLKCENLNIAEKFRNEKFFLINGWKIGAPFGTLTRQVEKLTRIWYASRLGWKIGTTLAR